MIESNPQLSKLKISDFNYDLPVERIAFFPKEERDQSKLLVYQDKKITDATFCEISNFLSDNDILVFNNSKVIHARLIVYNKTGTRIEIFCLEPISPTPVIATAFEQTKSVTWKCFVGNARKWKAPLTFNVFCKNQTITITTYKSEPKDGSFFVTFNWDDENITFADWLESYGKMPLPPYIKRDVSQIDEDRYQTIFAKHEGSVAAPTAGLHFSDDVFKSLKLKGINQQWITLHVGAGTFKPVSTEYVNDHYMHQEQIIVSKEILHFLLQNKKKRIIAVGTTVTRTLESIFIMGSKLKLRHPNPFYVNQWDPYESNVSKSLMSISTEDSIEALLDYLYNNQQDNIIGFTSLMIKPGYSHKIAKGILTNFHQPQSTLLLLIASYLGDDWKSVYDHALKNEYRFLSYGDANLYI